MILGHVGADEADPAIARAQDLARHLAARAVDGMIALPLDLADHASVEAAVDAALQVTVLEALEQSWRTAVDATVVALVLGALVAIALTRPGRTPGAARTVRTLDLLFMLPLGLETDRSCCGESG